MIRGMHIVLRAIERQDLLWMSVLREEWAG